MNRTTLATAAVAALALAAPAAVASAANAAAGDKQVVANGLFTPLSLAVNSNGAAIVSQNFAGQLVKVKKGAEPKVLATAAEGREIGAVSVRGGVVTYAVSWGNNEGGIVRQVRNGKTTTIGDVGAAERATNPDGANTYGFQDLPEDCEVPPFLQPYAGVQETHPYATAVAGQTVYVADAGANAVFEIADGEVTPVAALPAVEVEVSAEAAEALGLPECVAGHTVALEGVPTDIEVGPGGDLYVTSLPGGPEDGSLGANGGVYKIDAESGEVTRVVTGLVSATGLAVAPGGDLFVSELFTGRILRVPAAGGEPVLFRTAAMPAALEVRGGYLYATTNVMSGMEPGSAPNGKVMRFGL